MKFFKLYILCLASTFMCSAQNNFGIVSQSYNPKAGKENRYYFVPPQGILVPPKMQVLLVYETRNSFFKQKIPITKVGNRYSFSFKSPDSISVLVASIVNERKKVLRSNSFVVEKEIVVDNNREEGYIIYLHDKKGKKFIYSELTHNELTGLKGEYFALVRNQLELGE